MRKGGRYDVKIYQPITLALVFRKIPEKVLLQDIYRVLGDISEAQGGFRKK